MRVLIAHKGSLQNVPVLEKMSKYGVCEIAKNDEDCLTLFFSNEFDYVLISSSLGAEAALELCKEIRIDSKRLLLVYVTSNPVPEEKVLLLSSGFDLYISADTPLEELKVQLMVFLRREKDCPYNPCICFKGFCLKPECSMLYFGEQPVCLRRKEYDLMEYLAINIGRTLTKDLILGHTWSHGINTPSNTLDVHIRSLRLKLGKYTTEKVIVTRRGYGYVLFP